MSKPALFLEPEDLKQIFFAGIAAVTEVIEPECIHRVLNTLARLADSPARTPAAAEGIRRLADFIEGKEPPEPDPRPRLKVVSGGGSAA